MRRPTQREEGGPALVGSQEEREESGGSVYCRCVACWQVPDLDSGHAVGDHDYYYSVKVLRGHVCTE